MQVLYLFWVFPQLGKSILSDVNDLNTYNIAKFLKTDRKL